MTSSRLKTIPVVTVRSTAVKSPYQIQFGASHLTVPPVMIGTARPSVAVGMLKSPIPLGVWEGSLSRK